MPCLDYAIVGLSYHFQITNQTAVVATVIPFWDDDCYFFLGFIFENMVTCKMNIVRHINVFIGSCQIHRSGKRRERVIDEGIMVCPLGEEGNWRSIFWAYWYKMMLIAFYLCWSGQTFEWLFPVFQSILFYYCCVRFYIEVFVYQADYRLFPVKELACRSSHYIFVLRLKFKSAYVNVKF
jgi:hypothetical protein